MSAITHIKSETIGNWTGAVTVFNSAGTTTTANATDLVQPQDWNSKHALNFTISGNTAGVSSSTGTNLVYGATDGLKVSLSTVAGAATLWMGDNVTISTAHQRQLGASSGIVPANTTLWLVPFRLDHYLSASTLQVMQSYTGTVTTASTAQAGQTLSVALYSQNATASARFDSFWSDSVKATFWNSGTSSYSFAYSMSTGQVTSSSAGSNIGTASVMGLRQHLFTIGSTLSPGLYMYGINQSTSSANVSANMRSMALIYDNPLSAGMGSMNQATNANIGYVDAGYYSAGTGGFPASINLTNDIKQSNNLVPYFKIGAY